MNQDLPSHNAIKECINKFILPYQYEIFTLIFGIILLISAILSFIFSIMLVYYDGKIVGCVELFDLMLKDKSKKRQQ